jgi:hypothetical protein
MGRGGERFPFLYSAIAARGWLSSNTLIGEYS